jgi:chitin synthase
VYNKDVFDLSDLIYTMSLSSGADTRYNFLDSDVLDVFKQQSGQDITKDLDKVFATKDADVKAQNLQCLQNAFYIGKVDFRKKARCQVQNYLLITASVIIMASIAIKCG